MSTPSMPPLPDVRVRVREDGWVRFMFPPGEERVRVLVTGTPSPGERVRWVELPRGAIELAQAELRRPRCIHHPDRVAQTTQQRGAEDNGALWALCARCTHEARSRGEVCHGLRGRRKRRRCL